MAIMATINNELWRKDAPPVHELSSLELPVLRKENLPNGIPLYILNQGETAVCRLGIFIRGGCSESYTPSVASLAASLMREGSGRYPAENLADLFERNGAWIDTAAHNHYTAIHVYSLNNRFNEVLPGVADMIINPEFSDDVFEIFRENKARNLETDMCKVSVIASRESDRIFYGKDHPMGRIEHPDNIRDINVDEIRNFHSERCNASDITLFLTGKINEEAIKTVSAGFGSLTNDRKPYSLSKMLPEGKWDKDVQTFSLLAANQTAVKMTIPAISRANDDYEMLRVAVCGLGGYFGSRLNTNIREEKGLTYGITSSIIGIDGFGAINISCQCDERYVDTVIREIRYELDRMKSGDYTDDEIARLKRFYMTSLSGILESPFSVMDFYESSFIADIPSDYFAQQLRALENLSPAMLREIASKYFHHDEALTVVVGKN